MGDMADDARELEYEWQLHKKGHCLPDFCPFCDEEETQACTPEDTP